MLKTLIGMLLMFALVACGGGDGKSTPAGGGGDDACGCACGEEEEEEEESGGKAYSESMGTATIKGFAKFEGKTPRRRPVDMGTEKHCTGVHTTPFLSETAIVGKDGGLQNVFVRVTGGLSGWSFPKPSGEKLLDQDGCVYKPHVMGIQVGQDLRIRNSDPIMHNVHGIDKETGRDLFNISQISKGKEDVKSFRRAGIVYVKCEVHGWMGAYIGVADSPFYAVTGADGSFTIGKLPPGTYELEAWHEKYDAQKATVTVADGATGEVSFTFKK